MHEMGPVSLSRINLAVPQDLACAHCTISHQLGELKLGRGKRSPSRNSDAGQLFTRYRGELASSMFHWRVSRDFCGS